MLAAHTFAFSFDEINNRRGFPKLKPLTSNNSATSSRPSTLARETVTVNLQYTMRQPQNSAMITAPAVVVGAPAITGAVMCAVSLVASARPMRIEIPKISLPNLSDIKLPEIKLPDIDLPGFGKKKDAAPAPPKKTAAPRVAAGKVKVRAAKGVIPSPSGAEAPTLAELTGEVVADSIEAGEGYKKFPERRMPGANMDSWKKIAKDITPQV